MPWLPERTDSAVRPSLSGGRIAQFVGQDTLGIDGNLYEPL